MASWSLSYKYLVISPHSLGCICWVREEWARFDEELKECEGKC